MDDPDEEDMDTDEEKAISLSPVKPDREREKTSTTTQGEKNGKVKDQGIAIPESKPTNDSQELFNSSLEAELYPVGSKMTKQVTATTVSPIKPVSQPPPQLTRSKIAEPVTSPTLPMPKTDSDDDTQKSILYELF